MFSLEAVSHRQHFSFWAEGLEHWVLVEEPLRCWVVLQAFVLAAETVVLNFAEGEVFVDGRFDD